MAWIVETVPGDGSELNQSDTLFVLTGDNTKFALWKGGTDAVFAEGRNQTITEEYAGPNFIYDFGRNLNITFNPEAYVDQPMTVRGFYEATGAHVTLSADFGQTATETQYRDGYEWGTKLTVSGSQQQPNTAFFPYVQHVAVVTS